MDILALLLLIAFGGWFWSDSTQARETALAAAARFCKQTDVQFLDQTVTLSHLKPARATSGHIILQRVYRFEFCTTGAERYPGFVTMKGQKMTLIELDHPDGKVIS